MPRCIGCSSAMKWPELAASIERSWYSDSSLTPWLRPLSVVFGSIAATRRRAFRARWFRQQRIGAPVVVVGNITVGGTGKTPVVAWLAERLAAAGRRPGIVSRGYGGRVGSGPHMVAPDDPAELVGDEPLLLRRRTGLPVCVGSDRAAAAKALVVQGASSIVSDDGMQHYALARDLEIAVLDSQRMTGNGLLLPAGPLREPLDRLDTVDLLLVNGELQPARGFGFLLEPRGLKSLSDERELPLQEFAGRQVWAVAGIGNPARFEQTLRKAGIETTLVALPDHGATDLAALREKADQPIIMTEKDAVKYPATPVADAWYLPVDFAPAETTREALESSLLQLFTETAAANGADRRRA
jgi:tetraacyldisaccharide 4'-kinase